MVYVPFVVVRRLLLRRWEKKRLENPELPRPTVWEIQLEWFKILDWLPPRGDPTFRQFMNQFPAEDRGRISR